MSATFILNFNSSRFALTGFPGLEVDYLWLSIPFASIWLWFSWGTAWCSRDQDWAESAPAHVLLPGHAGPHWPVCGAVHRIQCWESMGIIQEISLDSCIAQSYFIHGLSFMESSVLLTMAFDRHIAICNPLRYSSILTNDKIMKIGVAILCRSSMLIISSHYSPKVLKLLSNFTSFHSFCLHQDLIRMACSDIRLIASMVWPRWSATCCWMQCSLLSPISWSCMQS